MSVRTWRWCFLIFLLAGIGCSQSPRRIQPPSINASSAGAAAIEMYDANKDGKISGSELDQSGALKSALARIDADKDGAITAEEIAQRIKAWQETRYGRMSVACNVTYNGAPLGNAVVRFVPEKFLGSDIQEGKGETSSGGTAMISIERSDSSPPGIAPGFYRIEITKAGSNIPAKFNTETILGTEVAQDSPAVMEGVVRLILK